MSEKIVIERLYKIFGSKPDEAMELLAQGLGKDAIFERTGLTVGVEDASFAVREGEIFVVMGLSGSGKSTLVRMLNRLIEPTAGKVYIDGRDVTLMSKPELISLRRHDMSMVFQSFALMPHRTVVDNVAFGLEVAGLDKARRQDRALAALEQVGLKTYAQSYPDELSGGMQQRVGLARALAGDPSILLMDEAFSALDPLIRTEMQDELVTLQQQHQRTVVFISHDLDEAMRIGDRIAVMQGGRVVQIGTPEEIVTRPANDYVRSFFYGVDISQVLSAGDIADRKQMTVLERPGVSIRAAIDQLRRHGRELAIIIGKDHHYQGMVTADSLAAQLSGRGEPRYAKAFVEDIEPLPAETGLNDAMGRVAQSRYPLPVVDGQGRYIGTLSKTTLLEALNRTS